MDRYLKDFEVENKNPSEEAIRRWRNDVAIVKNPSRRFRFFADLAERSAAEKKKLQIQEKIRVALYVQKAAQQFQGFDVQIQLPRKIEEKVANTSVSAQWMFLLASLCLEIVSAVFEQVSSPRKPYFALIAMVLAILALLTCITELFLKAKKERVRFVWWGMLPLLYHQPPRNRLFGTFSDVFGLLGVSFQLAFSIVQYAYFRRQVDNPIKVCLWPFLFIFCVAGSILIQNRRNTEDKHETGERDA